MHFSALLKKSVVIEKANIQKSEKIHLSNLANICLNHELFKSLIRAHKVKIAKAAILRNNNLKPNLIFEENMKKNLNLK